MRYTYLLTRQMHTVLCPYQNLGLVLPGWIISQTNKMTEFPNFELYYKLCVIKVASVIEFKHALLPIIFMI